MRFLNRVFNYKFALLALFQALVVTLINVYRNDVDEALQAGEVQIVIGVVSAGVGAKVIECLSKFRHSLTVSYFLAGLVGFLSKIICGFIGHKLSNTPEFGLSVIVPATGSIVGALLFNYILRNINYLKAHRWLALLRYLI